MEEGTTIEEIIMDYLISRDIDWIRNHVYMEKPEKKIEEYVLIEKTGSGQTDKIDRAMVAIKSISAKRMVRAARINECVKKEMMRMAELSDAVYSCDLVSDYNFTDTETKEYRYQAVFNLHF